MSNSDKESAGTGCLRNVLRQEADKGLSVRLRAVNMTLQKLTSKFSNLSKKLLSMTHNGNSFFSLPKCKVCFVRSHLTCKVVPYKKILVENESPYKKPCKVDPYKKIYLKMSAYIKSHVRLHLTCNVVPYKK